MKEEFIKLIKNGLTRKNDTMIANVGVDGVINFYKDFYWSYKPLDVGLIFSFNDRLIFS